MFCISGNKNAATYNGEVRLTFSVQYSDDMGLEKSVPQSWNVRVTNCGIYKR